ncbi:MAG: DUF3124 domain-containing protein [Siculibacillus sp.]|nr:DUF3124 domain-containing protein [Siculibacillus sp.]
MRKTGLRRCLASFPLLLWLGAAATAQPAADPLAASRAALIAGSDIGAAVVAGETYVPTHSSIVAGDGRTRIDFAVTLSVHNASETRPLRLTRIDYFDGAGRLVQKYLAAPVLVRPFGTVEIFVAKNDTRAGTGANFIVGWNADAAIAEPVIEAVMIGDFANQSYSFVSLGRRIETIAPVRP